MHVSNLRPNRGCCCHMYSRRVLLCRTCGGIFNGATRSTFDRFALPTASASSFATIIFGSLRRRARAFQTLYRRVGGIGCSFIIFGNSYMSSPISRGRTADFVDRLARKIYNSHVPAFFVHNGRRVHGTCSVNLHSRCSCMKSEACNSFG